MPVSTRLRGRRKDENQRETFIDENRLHYRQNPLDWFWSNAFCFLFGGVLVYFLLTLQHQSFQHHFSINSESGQDSLTNSSSNEKAAFATGSAVEQAARMGGQPVEGSSRTLKDLVGSRILVCIVSFNMEQYIHLGRLLDSYVDACEAGADVDILVYSSLLWSAEVRALVIQRLHCQRIERPLTFSLIVREPRVRLFLTNEHRKDMYDRIEDYDYFVYSEVRMLLFRTFDLI